MDDATKDTGDSWLEAAVVEMLGMPVDRFGLSGVIQSTRKRLVVRLLSLTARLAPGLGGDTEAMTDELEACAAEVDGDPQLSPLVEGVRAMLLLRRAVDHGNHSAILELPGLVAKLRSTLPDDPTVAQHTEQLRVVAEALVRVQAGDASGILANLPRSQEVTGAGAGWAADAGMASLMDAYRVETALFAGVESMLGMEHETDPDRISQVIVQYRKVLAEIPPRHPRCAFCLVSVVLALIRRGEVTGKLTDLTEASGLLEEARQLINHPQDPLWMLVQMTRSAIAQRVCDHSSFAGAAVAAQRGYAWRVLLEAVPGGMYSSVKDAASHAIDNARHAIAVGDPAGGLRALDAGRGLMLFAATEAHRIPARLAAAGRHDLASQWTRRQAPSDQLRQRVLAVLAEQSAGSLFDPPTLAQVQTALRLLDADVLAYLVPGQAPHPGLAVLAPAVGPPAFMALPHLDFANGTEVDRYLLTLTTRASVGPGRELSAEEDNGFRHRVAELCRWAWRAAIGPLLDSYLPRLPAPPGGRVPRIILIPMGDLARVPWHAARRGDGVYAVQLAAVSQAVSARLFCENAALAPVRLGATGLVVGDPDTGGRAVPLRSARLEAYAVRQAFYRGARYLGRLPDGRCSPSGAGTVGEVRAWLMDQQLSAGSMLHLACHSDYAAGSADSSRLLLAAGGAGVGGPAPDLTAGELVDLLAQVPDRAIGLVVLAACNSGRSVYGYDEAYSLGTGFLAGGARSVLSTQWSVPDAATSSLMYIFHHHSRRQGLPAWQALRRAQIWMLDPSREPPPAMPPELVPGPDDDPADPLNWAGFVHYGH